MNARRLGRGGLLAYAAFALPLAMAALPIYVHVPKLYSAIGVPLAWVGAILLCARLFDALQDPLLGWLSDRAARSAGGRALPIIAGVPLLGSGLLALLNPPQAAPTLLATWLGASLVVTYLGFSAASISYLAMGAELSNDYHERTRVTATRGAIGVLGVLAAAMLPGWLGEGNEQRGLLQFAWVFVPLLLVCCAITLLTARRSVRAHPHAHWKTTLAPLRSAGFRWLAAVSIASGVAGAIPATLVLFFVDDVLALPRHAGLFLALYFVSGALSMPLWIGAARRLGKKNAWLIGMVLAVTAFIWAFALGEGDLRQFALVCVVSGLAYGAELAIPPSLLADVVEASGRSAGGAQAGTFFGLWQMIEKLTLALAAGIALPLLGTLGYEPGTVQRSAVALSAVYALLPCGIKLGAAALLWHSPLDRVRLIDGRHAIGGQTQ